MRFARWVIGALLLIACMGQDFGGGALDGDGPTDALGGSTSVVGRGPYAGDPTAIWDSAPDGSESWGPETLPASITINGITETPVFRYVGSGASASSWAADGYGDALASYTGPGSAEPDLDQPGPWTDGSEGVAFGSTDHVYGSTAANDGALTTGDIVIEALVTVTSQTAERYIVSRYVSAAQAAWRLYTRYAAGVTYLAWLSSDGPNIVSGAASLTALDVGTWNHIIIFIDRSGSLGAYVNGVSAGSASVSASTGTWNRPESRFLIGSQDTGAASYDGTIALVQAWTRSGWLDTHAQATVAKQRWARVAGLVGKENNADAFPTTNTRANPTWARYCDASANVTRYFKLGKNWIAKESSCDGAWQDPTAALTFTGPLIEATFSNLALQSSDMATTWSTVNAAIDVNQANDPSGAATMDDIDGTAADDEHGVSQAITLTADDHTLSVYARAGNVDHIYLTDDTVTNAWAYFDLTTCEPTSNGVAARTSWEDLGGGLCRVGIGFVGTAASHTVRVLCAEADGDKVYAGAAGDCTVGWAQLSNVAFPGSYVATTTASATKNADDLRWTLTARDPDQTTFIVDGFFQEDGFDTAEKGLLCYTDGGSAFEVTRTYSTSNTLKTNWFDNTTNLTITRSASPHDGARHIIRSVTDVASTTGNVCQDGECTSASGLNSVGSDYDEITFSSRTYTQQPYANIWRARMYGVAALPD